LLVGLIDIKHGLHLAYELGHRSVHYEIDSLDAVDTINDKFNHMFHPYTYMVQLMVKFLEQD
jgi:hypothetical protein